MHVFSHVLTITQLLSLHTHVLTLTHLFSHTLALNHMHVHIKYTLIFTHEYEFMN